MRRWMLLGLVLLSGVACTVAESPADAGVEVATADDDVTTAVSTSEFADSAMTVIDIESERGIGSLTLARTGNAWPSSVALRLHLNGLENLTLTFDDTELTLAVSSTADGQVLQSVNEGDPSAETQILSANDENWMEVEVSADGDAFLVMLPQALLTSSAETADVSWIDFYR